jgi:hypothetical protein
MGEVFYEFLGNVHVEIRRKLTREYVFLIDELLHHCEAYSESFYERLPFTCLGIVIVD